MNKLKIAFFGTPFFSARFLEKLITDTSINQLIEVKLVVTQPDKPVGKKQIITPSPVKNIAKKYNIDIYNFEIKDSLQIENLKLKIKEIDFALLFAYGFKYLIPKEIFSKTRIKLGNTGSGFINIHPSLLPKYRGASPIAYPLMLGDKITGVTLFVMDEKMDHGPIITQEELSISLSDRRPDLELKLTELALELFKRFVTKFVLSYKLGASELKHQDHAKATHAPYLTKDDGFIPIETLKKAVNNEQLTIDETPKLIKNFYQKNNLVMKQFNNLPAGSHGERIYNLFRGLYPWPGLWTLLHQSSAGQAILNKSKRLKITDMDYINENIIIKKVQLESKKEVDFKTFNDAYSIF